MSPKIEDSVPMSIEAAHHYADWLVNEEVRGPSDLDDAFTRLEQRYGISRHQLQHLRKGKAKTCDLGLFARLRGAYLDLCERQVRRLQHQIAIEKATGDDTIEDLEAEARALAAKIAAKKQALRATR